MDDRTATINGLTIGDGTVYGWKDWPSGLGTAQIRANDQARPRRSGLVGGDDVLGGREIVFTIQVKGTPTGIEEAMTDLSAAFAPAASDVWMDLRVTGSPAEYSLLGRARGCEWMLSKRYTFGLGDARCTFVATDPIKYGAEETVTITLGASGTGLEYPITYPVVYGGAAASGIASAPNAGKVPVEWTAVLTGPLPNPRLEHVETGTFVKIDATVPDGQTLTLDSRSGALLLDGSTPRPSWFGVGSSWFQLASGANSLRLIADADTGSAAITYRPGWP